MKKLLLALLPAVALAGLVGVWLLSSATASPGLTKVIIGFDRPPGAADEALVRGLGGSIKYTYDLIPAIAAELPEEALEALERNPNVAYVEEDLPRRVHDELDNSWGVNRIDAEEVHLDNNKGDGVSIAIIDTGIDCTHPDLDANCAGGYNFVANAPFPGTGPFDDYGHGTHVAGIVAALDNGSGVVGVAPQADLYALKVCDSSGSCPTSDIVAAMQWAADPNGDGETDDHLDVANLSLGSRFSSTAERQAAQATYDAGVLVVASAGNAGNCGGRNNSVEFPAGYDQVIAVAATNRDDLRPCFSSSGPDVELAAPGVDVLSTVPLGDCRLCTDTGYRGGTGTSMASPHVTGTAALLLAANPGWANSVVRQRLVNTADDLGPAGSDTWFGHGLVDAENAVLGSTAGNNLPPQPTPTATPTPEGATATPTPAAEATPTATPTSEPSVNSVSSIRLELAAKGPNYQAIAHVTVVDGSGNAVKQAPVSGQWTLNGDFLNDSSNTTNGRGAARLDSEKASAAGGDTFTIAITEPAAGVPDCSISVGTSSITCQ